MKTLRCRFLQLAIALGLADPENPGARQERHLQECPRCRQHNLSGTAIGRALRREAEARTAEIDIPSALRQRILARAGAETQSLPSHHRRVKPAAAFAAILLLALASWYGFQATDGPLYPVRETPGIASLASVDLRLPAGLPAWRGMAEEPLRAEWEAALDDSQRLLTGMVTSLLPSGTEGWLRP